MKISKVDNIKDYFREINTEAVFVALKEKKYSGFTRKSFSKEAKDNGFTGTNSLSRLRIISKKKIRPIPPPTGR